MTTVRARFDGKVFVPESPVELPVGYTLEIALPKQATPAERELRPLLALKEQLDKLPVNPDWPPDGAEQHDHYLYGTPKR